VGKPAAMMRADAEYKSEANFAALEAHGVDGCVSLGKGETQRAGTEAQGGPCTQRMSAKLRTTMDGDASSGGKAIVEPPLEWLKHVLGFRLLDRGHQKTAGEWSLVCLVMNPRRTRSVALAIA
jgi:hypothetical protein